MFWLSTGLRRMATVTVALSALFDGTGMCEAGQGVCVAGRGAWRSAGRDPCSGQMVIVT